SSVLAVQWTFAILAPSGKGLPLPGMPALYASIIMEFPRITASLSLLWLTAITCQLSYPLNSEKASPPGTFREYFSCCAKRVRPINRLRTPAVIENATTCLCLMCKSLLRDLTSNAGPTQFIGRCHAECCLSVSRPNKVQHGQLDVWL